MPVYGADVEQLRTLAGRMDMAARSLDTIAASLHAQVQGARWDGADGVRFLSDWSRQHRPSLREVARRLDDAARAIRENALVQERTSSASGGSGGHGERSWRNPSIPGWGEPGGQGWGRLNRLLPPWILEGNVLNPSLSAGQIESLLGKASRDGLMVGGAAGTIYDWALKSGNLDAVGGWMKAGTNVGFAGDAVGMFTGGFRLGDAIADGDWDGGIRSGLDIAWGFGSKIPIVGAVKSSWDLGHFIGDRIYDIGEVTGVNDAVQGSIIDQAIAKGHESDLGTRYDGLSGFGNFVKDSGSSFVKNLKFW